MVYLAGMTYFAVQNGWTFRASSISKYTVSNYVECVRKCESTPNCVSFTLMEYTGVCQLFSTTDSGGAPLMNALSGYKGGQKQYR